MRILHTADLHLGRQFNGISLDDDHAAILEQIVGALIAEQADVLVIAGDIFDRAAPPASAVRLFNGFLSRVASETDAAVVVSAGNHDSGDRIEAMSIMTDMRRALIRGVVSAEEPPLVLNDAHGAVAFSALPFAYEYAARDCFYDTAIQTPEDVLAAQVNAARRFLPDGVRWVIAAHAFVAGGTGSDSERPLARVGGIETVSPEIFKGAQYVALGHLHRPQSVRAEEGRYIRYCGAPLAFGFDEAGSAKSMSLVDLDGEGRMALKEIPFQPLRGVRLAEGKHAELMTAPPSEDFVKVVLTDETPVIDAMKRLRDTVFPNACELSYKRDARAPETKSLTRRTAKMAEPSDLIRAFLEDVGAEQMSDEEANVIALALHEIRQGEDAA